MAAPSEHTTPSRERSKGAGRVYVRVTAAAGAHDVEGRGGEDGELVRPAREDRVRATEPDEVGGEPHRLV